MSKEQFIQQARASNAVITKLIEVSPGKEYTLTYYFVLNSPGTSTTEEYTKTFQGTLSDIGTRYFGF